MTKLTKEEKLKMFKVKNISKHFPKKSKVEKPNKISEEIKLLRKKDMLKVKNILTAVPK